MDATKSYLKKKLSSISRRKLKRLKQIEKADEASKKREVKK